MFRVGYYQICIGAISMHKSIIFISSVSFHKLEEMRWKFLSTFANLSSFLHFHSKSCLRLNFTFICLKTSKKKFLHTHRQPRFSVRGAVLNSREAQELGVEYILADLEFQHKNILYEPLSPTVAKLVKDHNIKVLKYDY